jgi:hypothetical protein
METDPADNSGDVFGEPDVPGADAPSEEESELVSSYLVRVHLRKHPEQNLVALTNGQLEETISIGLEPLGYKASVSAERIDR